MYSLQASKVLPAEQRAPARGNRLSPNRALALGHAAQMKYAPQEIGIYSVTAVTAGRRRLSQALPGGAAGFSPR